VRDPGGAFGIAALQTFLTRRAPFHSNIGRSASRSSRRRPVEARFLTQEDHPMKARLNPFGVAPEAMKTIAAMEAYVQSSGLEASLIELVKTRASQINGCAYCIHMHTRDARARGESEERLYLLDAWRESPLYTERERAALAWTEAVTLVSQTHVPDAVYEEVRRHFAEDELVKLTHLVATINVWNRIAISFRSVHPVKRTEAAD
jgi:AhpD family alkylhydroperoxidase